ncbi:hypothetical protein NE237_001746 [Protea cynaroides]|uniref:Uncharacterized protein n=1 Tax=Protea cynaroides TaxID=273540 RepID=A0A9Q0KTW8_9MAGN|nr:hypothetical protein NE237_001746 [Protea cynaroides]
MYGTVPDNECVYLFRRPMVLLAATAAAAGHDYSDALEKHSLLRKPMLCAANDLFAGQAFLTSHAHFRALWLNHLIQLFGTNHFIFANHGKRFHTLTLSLAWHSESAGANSQLRILITTVLASDKGFLFPHCFYNLRRYSLEFSLSDQCYRFRRKTPSNLRELQAALDVVDKAFLSLCRYEF